MTDIDIDTIEPFRKWAEYWADEPDERVAYSVRYDDQEIAITVGNLRALIAALRERDKRIAELEDALKPFADEAEFWGEMSDTRPILSLPMTDYSEGPTVGDLRRALATLGENDG